MPFGYVNRSYAGESAENAGLEGLRVGFQPRAYGVGFAGPVGRRSRRSSVNSDIVGGPSEGAP